MKNLKAHRIIIVACMITMINACSFKKNPQSDQDIPTSVVLKDQEVDSLNQSIAKAINKLSPEESIIYLSRFSVEELDKYQESGLSLLDIVIKNGSSHLLSSLLSRGLNPINFSNESEQILSFDKNLDSIHKSFLDVAFGDLFENVFPRYESLSENLLKKQPTPAACRYLIKTLINQHFGLEYHPFFNGLGQMTHFSERTSNSLSAILHSKSCGATKQQLSYDDMSKWYSMEILYQTEKKFDSPTLIQFFNTLGNFQDISINFPAIFGDRRINPLIFLLAVDMKPEDWNLISDTWWRLLSPGISKRIGYYDLDIYENESFCSTKKRRLGNMCVEKDVLNEVCTLFKIKCLFEEDPYETAKPFPPPPNFPESGGS